MKYIYKTLLFALIFVFVMLPAFVIAHGEIADEHSGVTSQTALPSPAEKYTGPAMLALILGGVAWYFLKKKKQ